MTAQSRWTALFTFFSLIAAATPANAWWNDSWAFRKEVTVDMSASGAGIAEELTNVPLLVRFSIANFPYFADAKADGSDLRVVAADDKTSLKFHIEKFDAQAQIALLWVQLPTAAASSADTKLYIYYGNAEAAAASDSAGTYDSPQALVYHFAQASGPQDSSSYKSEPQAGALKLSPGSLIGSGLQVDGTAGVRVAATQPLRVVAAQGYTLSAWVKAEAGQALATIATVTDATHQLVLAIEQDRVVARWRNGAQPEVVIRQADGSVAGEWHHVALRLKPDSLAVFVDGLAVATAPATAADFDGAISLGIAADGKDGLRGEIDEFQVAGTARSDGWLQAAARSQGQIASLVRYGADAQKEEGGGQSYFASTLRNVTVDGWVIIGILMVLFIAAVIIMTVKTLYLNRVSTDNARFLAEYRAATERDAQLAGPDYGTSTLWQLYSHGSGETRKRLAGATPEKARNLSAQSIEAIRATMDAVLVRSLQKLQSQMVWLTIAISGGPFLGLLGTVVGVMITFAAIAASGDVNINAIAPGTAAALVATVAGLGVAIPCLFGYNYLNTRIREISADMNVFVDEYVTRIAETYST
jgi:biopolymer transport protein ExbB